MRTMLLSCAVLLLLGSGATIAGRDAETMDARVYKLEKAVSAITEELAENRKLFKDFLDTVSNKD